MESKGIYMNYKELDTLVDKFDKNKDGRISFTEFMEEMLPQSPAKAY
jgi:Ca2+-binding EF-hand superfamily protein